MPTLRLPASLLILACWLSVALQAQCGVTAVPGFAHLGPSGPVDAICYWDPDGAGPMATQLFVGGRFAFVERLECSGAALYDANLQSWSVLPPGPIEQVRAAAVDAAGRLVVAGSHGTGVGLQHRVATFDGTNWALLGSSFDAPVLTVSLHAGEVIVGGEFQQHGGAMLPGLARWDGAVWRSIGGGVAGVGGGVVAALCSLPNGTLVVGGSFATAGSTQVANIASWDGTSWLALGAGLPPQVTSIAVFSTGELFATGWNQNAPAQWDGIAWTELAGLAAPQSGQASSWVGELAVGQGYNGEALYAVGSFSIQWMDGNVAEWDPLLGWSYVSAQLAGLEQTGPTPLAMALPAAQAPFTAAVIAVAGPFDAVLGRSCSGIAIIRGFAVDPLGAGIDGEVLASVAWRNGDLLLGGRFSAVERELAPALVRGDRSGQCWQPPLLTGSAAIRGSFGSAEVRAMVATEDGGCLLGGSFIVGNQLGFDIAHYDGANFTAYGPSPFVGSGANAVMQQ